jgi:Subunit ChlI of Mg-chelatase
MPSKVYSAAVVGVEAFEVEIEVHAGWGNIDKIAVVGLPDTAVKESKDRVTSAICNSGLRWPYGKRITINLAPADVRKEGPSFDLPIALGMLKLEENNRLPALDAFCITGELALSGRLRPVKGFSRSPWKPNAAAGRLSSCLSRMPRKPPWWRRRCLRSLFAFAGRAFFARGYRLGSGALNQRLARRRIR